MQAILLSAPSDEAVARVIDFHTRPRRKAKQCLGHYMVGYNAKYEAICIVWQDGRWGHVDGDTLRAIFSEVRGAKYKGPIHVHGATSLISESEGFRFHQMKD